MRKIELDDDEVSVERRGLLALSKVELIERIERLQSELHVAQMNIYNLKYSTNAKGTFVINTSNTNTSSTLRVVVR